MLDDVGVLDPRPLARRSRIDLIQPSFDSLHVP